MESSVVSLHDAREHGALMQFDEKYGDWVRMVSVPGVSTELCGGTHVSHTSSVFPFKIVSESSVAAGTRRITAVCGRAALEHLDERDAAFQQCAKVLSMAATEPPAHVVRRLERLSGKARELERDLAKRVGADGGGNVTVLRCRPSEGGFPFVADGVTAEGSVLLHILAGAPGLTDEPEERQHREHAQIARKVAQSVSSDGGTDAVLHFVLCGRAIACVAPAPSGANVHAGKALKFVLDAAGGKGGGGASFGQGVIDSKDSEVALRRALGVQ